MAGATTLLHRPAATGRLRRRLRLRRQRGLVIAGAWGVIGLLVGMFVGGLRPGFPTPVPRPADPAALPDKRVVDPDTGEVNQPGYDQPGPDERVVAVVRPLALPPLQPGDQVELMAVVQDELGRPTVRQIGPAVGVVAIDGDVVAVAVPTASVRDLLAQQAAGRIEIIAVP